MAIKTAYGFAADTTLATACTAAEKYLYLTSNVNWPDGSNDNFVIQIGSEYIVCSKLSTRVLTVVTRGYNGTTAAIHAALATVTVLGYLNIRTEHDAPGFLAQANVAAATSAIAAFEGNPSSANFAAALTDESGTGVVQLRLRTNANAITASATQTQVGATALTADMSRVTVVASADNAVKLPASEAGLVRYVKNAHATNQIGIFPASGDKINALATDAVYALPALKAVAFVCFVAGTWDTILTA